MAINIVYPFSNGSYPITDPPVSALRSAYLTFSFSVSCKGGGHWAKWGVDKINLGRASFYDQFSAQFVGKLAGGRHIFWVESDCAKRKQVRFSVG